MLEVLKGIDAVLVVTVGVMVVVIVLLVVVCCTLEVCAFCSYGGASAPQQLQRCHFIVRKR